MNLDMNTLREIVTVVSFLAFVAIIGWVSARGNASRFDEASRIPFDDEEGK